MENEHEKSPWLVLILVLFGSGVGVVFGSGLGGFVAMQLYQGEGSFQQAVASPSDAIRVPLYAIQGITALFGMVVVPGLVWWRLRQKPISSFFATGTRWPLFLLVAFLVIAFAVVDTVIIQWNKNLSLPSLLHDFEQWAQAQEQVLERLTKVLVDFANPGEFLLGLLVIGVVAGLAEEFFFRGLIQTELVKATRNPHVAIWLTAIAFSAVHLQFYGFFPRMLLGALFGYLYWWSGDLWIPVLAHTVNNAFSLVVVYIASERTLPLDVENEAAPWPAVLIFFVITVFLIQKVYRTFHPRLP